jgi:uncharacterized NAD(P)/FAD-binding protein YdhS
MTRIAIVGAGLCGRLVALQLLRQASSSVGIRLIDRADERSMGPAYSLDADDLLLNVPAARMGAFPDDHEHFLKWAQQRGIHAGPWDFLPRRLYRDYVFDLIRQARQERPNGPQFEHVRADVTDIEVAGDRAALHCVSAATVIADKAVLALGNFPPRDPHVAHSAALESPRYVRNAWESDVLDAVPHRETVFLIGTGQTMVDIAITLHARGHEGRIVGISRHGALPLAHRGFDSYPPFLDELSECTRLLHMFRTVRAHLRRAEAAGIDPRAVIDSLRPGTQSLWLRLPDAEKRRFLRHVFRHWEIIRSRLPPQSRALIDAMHASGQLEIVAGRIRDLVDNGATIEVHYTRRAGGAIEVERAALVVNCIGPETDYERIDDALVKNLLRRGLIRKGPADLGIDTLPGGAIIGRDGSASSTLYTLGSTMKGVLWEVLAVPDIRVQAPRLASRLTQHEAA